MSKTVNPKVDGPTCLPEHPQVYTIGGTNTMTPETVTAELLRVAVDAQTVIKQTADQLPGLLRILEAAGMTNDDGMPNSTPGAGKPPSGKGNISDSTGSTALRLIEHGYTGDSSIALSNLAMVRHGIKSIAYCCAKIQAHSAIINEIARQWEPATPVTPQARGVLVCANLHGCPDGNFAEKGRRGRCKTCCQYLIKHDRDRATRDPRKGTTRNAT